MDACIEARLEELRQRIELLSIALSNSTDSLDYVPIVAIVASAIVSVTVPFVTYVTQKWLAQKSAKLEADQAASARRLQSLREAYLLVDDVVQDLRSSFFVLLDAHQGLFAMSDEHGEGRPDVQRLQKSLFPATEFQYVKELSTVRLSVRLYMHHQSAMVEAIYERRLVFAQRMQEAGSKMIGANSYRELVEMRAAIVEPPKTALNEFVNACSDLRRAIEAELKSFEHRPTS